MDFPNIRDAVIALDYETTGLRWWVDRAFSFAISTKDGDWYYDVRDTPGAVEWLARNLHTARVVYAHNAKFECHFTRELTGYPIGNIPWKCTMVRAALIDEHLPTYNLDFVGKKYVGIGKDGDLLGDLAEIFGRKLSKDALMKRLHEAPKRIVAKYAMQDTNTTLKLGMWQEDEILRQGLEGVDKLEHELLPVLVDMELYGVRVDVEKAEQAAHDIDVMCERDQMALDKEAGFKVNPNPSGSTHKLFAPKFIVTRPAAAATDSTPAIPETGYWELIDGTRAESTEAGKPSIDADCLRRMKHPLAKKILKLRKYMKARDTFLRGHILGNHHNGLIHCNINQTKGENDAGTGSGRLSINSPALQQISARDKEIAEIVRAIFIPDNGTSWVSIDWAQVDFRVAAHYVQDPGINRSYAENPSADFHQMVADITGLPRSPRFAGDPNAKQINLGLAFGMGSGKLAAEMGLPYTIEEYRGKQYLKPGPAAEEVFEKYHGAIPGIREFMMRASATARTRGYVRSLIGRHIRFPGGQFVHKAAGLLYQSGAADMQKIKIIECHKLAKELGARLMLSVHDELNFSAENDPEAIEKINSLYCDFGSPEARLKLRVPIMSSVGVGPNWWIASK